MHKPVISQQLSLSRCLPTKTIYFGGSPESSRKFNTKQKQKRVKSSRTRTVDNEANLEIVMKLSEIYTNPTKFFDSLISRTSPANTSAFANKKFQTAPSIKRILLKSALLNHNKKQQTTEMHFNVSPVKQNNYKYFPKRETKLKNTSPYRFCMLNQKLHLRQKQASQGSQMRSSLPNKLRSTTDCSSMARSNSLNRQNKIQEQINRKSKEVIIQPWYHSNEPHEDMAGFC